MQQHLGDKTPYEDPAISVLGAGMGFLSEQERDAMRQLDVIHRFVGRGRSLIREAERVTHIRVLCKGWAMRSRRLDHERRQVLDFVLPGDMMGLHVDGAGASICDVEALTPCEVAEIGLSALERVAYLNRGVGAGLNGYLTRQLTQANDQLMRLGRMNAYERVSSFLMDIYTRQRHLAVFHGRVDFPITQTVVADMLGLSVVHVNRQVMRLRREGVVTLDRKQLVIHDERRLCDVSGYRDRGFGTRQSVFMAAE
jgi:CRP-like cAMP-binding protein